ncbi:MAG: RNA polymerase sigma factor [Gammaproteobacteria bacterium]
MDSPRATLDAVFVAQRPTLIRWLTRLVGCASSAEDLAHEAYVRAATSLASGPIPYPQPFLYQTARHLALDHLRHERVQAQALVSQDQAPPLEAIASAAPGPDRIAMARETFEQLVAVLGTLPRRRREILILHKLHHWSYERIAAHFGISKSGVQKHVRAALAACLPPATGKKT